MQNNKEFLRPLWTNQEIRNDSKYWLDKNEINIEESFQFNKFILEGLKPLDLSTYPDLSFCYKNLEKVFKINEKNTLFVNGSDGGIREVNFNFLNSFQPIILQPTFAMIGIYPVNLKNKPISINYYRRNNILEFDYSELLKKISLSEKPPLLIFATPDSPTGCVISISEIKLLIKEVEKKEGLILVDGTYALIDGYEKMLEIIKNIHESPNALFTASFSKSPGLAGARLGFLTGSEYFINRIRSTRPMYEIGAIQASIFNTVLSNWPTCLKVINAIQENKKELEKILKIKSPTLLNTAGNFTLFESTPELDIILNKICYYRKNFNMECLRDFSRLSTPSKAFLKDFKKSLNLL